MFKLTLDKNIVLIGAVVTGVIIAGVLIFTGNNAGDFNFLGVFGESNEKIAQKAVDYINDNGLAGSQASLVSASEESGIVKIKIKIGTNEFDSYVTKDGKYLFPQAIEISGADETDDSSGQPANGQSQDSGEKNFSVTESDHIRGDVNAQITLVEFSDFECPFCQKLFPTIEEILTDYEGDVRLVYKHFPLDGHPNARKAAEASECASEQGKFWEYHDKLFENMEGGYSLEKFKQWAKDLKLNATEFNSCLDTGKFAQKVQDDFLEGADKGVTGTPATFVNGQLVSGAQSYESFKQIIDSLLGI